MAPGPNATTTKRYAVVTGANKGIGFEICRQLASNGIVVVLTARNENRGLESVKKLKNAGISDDHLVFHQLNVLDSESVGSLADFIRTKFGKLDILVNNAGIGGVVLNPDNLQRTFELGGGLSYENQATWNGLSTQTFEMAELCLETNYYGGRRMVEALAPLLQLSDSARIVNVSSMLGLLQNIPSEWAKGVLGDVESLNEDRVDEVVNEFLEDFQDGLLESNGWPTNLSAYIVAKAAVNAYTRVVANKYPSFLVNAVCPGSCKTDFAHNVGLLSAAEGAESPVRLALLPKDGPSGCFFYRKEISRF
ncbi:(+)-neomenthol dehydrogenase [Ricinus communis]|uniref:(+)-neomenthol dehydrogenase n=1 Tax=Ricinus communis TaxID=3988 RepID=UPI00201A8442|nr:(+)-neomenthol dehydrogenase [Ricinus communis]